MDWDLDFRIRAGGWRSLQDAGHFFFELSPPNTEALWQGRSPAEFWYDLNLNAWFFD